MNTISLHRLYHLSGSFLWGLIVYVGMGLLPGSSLHAQVSTDSVTVPVDSVAEPDTIAPPKVGKGNRGGNRPTATTEEKSNDTIVNGNLIIVQDSSESVVRRKKTQKDTTLSRRQLRLANLAPPDPDVALRRSLILPGWGQAYNRQAWKIPIFYAGLGGAAYLFIDSRRQYQYYRDAAICAAFPTCDNNDGIEEFEGLSQGNIIQIREFYRRNRDLAVIGAGLVYLATAADAYISAHLQPFDVSDDLTLKIHPTFHTDPFQRRNVYLGAGISLGFRK